MYDTVSCIIMCSSVLAIAFVGLVYNMVFAFMDERKRRKWDKYF
jgi:hypothetical protein